MSKAALYTILVESANAAGFPLSGGVDIARAQAAMREHVARYDEWLGRGYAGAMDYLARGRDRRAEPAAVFPGAKSVFCVGAPYDAQLLGFAEASRGPRYARYLRARDYHRELAERLEQALGQASARWAEQGGSSFRWKVCIDTSAVLERSWAALAGLGWIGKNTLLIHPKLGSYFFVGEAILDIELDRGPTPLPDFCGHCDRCQTACPTGAFPAPHTLDANRCISYLTLEKRGPLDPDENLRRGTGRWIAGCDICQEVCPFNQKAARAAEAREQGNDGRYAQDWIALISETESEYAASVRDSALRRVKPASFSRNLAVAFTNAWGEMTAEERATLALPAAEAIRKRLGQEGLLLKSISPDSPSGGLGSPFALWKECLALVLDGRVPI